MVHTMLARAVNYTRFNRRFYAKKLPIQRCAQFDYRLQPKTHDAISGPDALTEFLYVARKHIDVESVNNGLSQCDCLKSRETESGKYIDKLSTEQTRGRPRHASRIHDSFLANNTMHLDAQADYVLITPEMRARFNAEYSICASLRPRECELEMCAYPDCSCLGG